VAAHNVVDVELVRPGRVVTVARVVDIESVGPEDDGVVVLVYVACIDYRSGGLLVRLHVCVQLSYAKLNFLTAHA
jgi:hypothetical protein